MTVRTMLTLIITADAVGCGGPDAGAPCDAIGDGFFRRDPGEPSCID